MQLVLNVPSDFSILLQVPPFLHGSSLHGFISQKKRKKLSTFLKNIESLFLHREKILCIH